jgi:AcrR family transcriptional regulator
MSQLNKGRLKRDIIIKATIELVNSNGFHGTPMSKLAKLAGVSPGTIYLYFESKQDLVNKVYLEVKERFSKFAFANYSTKSSVEDGFKEMWYRIAEFKLKETQEAIFLTQCDNTPVIDEAIRQEGIVHLAPLLDLWQRGKKEGLIKPFSDYILYAYTITPISFLIVMQNRDTFSFTKVVLNQVYKAAWDSIRN